MAVEDLIISIPRYFIAIIGALGGLLTIYIILTIIKIFMLKKQIKLLSELKKDVKFIKSKISKNTLILSWAESKGLSKYDVIKWIGTSRPTSTGCLCVCCINAVMPEDINRASIFLKHWIPCTPVLECFYRGDITEWLKSGCHSWTHVSGVHVFWLL